jgi:AcrR family transcriptional regulator
MPDLSDRHSVDAEAAESETPAVGSARVPLSRERIVSAAIAMIDDRGVASLSMRRLGKSLDVEAMSLYRYLPGREELLDAVVDTIIDSMYIDPEVVIQPSNGWQDYLQRLAHGIRRVALAHPKAFPLVASRPPEAPWLRPPLRNLRWVESFLDGLLEEGFTEEGAVAAYRAFTSFLLGHLLLEVSTLGADITPLDEMSDDAAQGSLAEYDRIRQLRSQLAEDHSFAEFEDSLENLLGRLSVIRAETGSI